MSNRRGPIPFVFCRECAHIVRALGIEAWRVCRHCHRRGGLMYLHTALAQGQLDAETFAALATGNGVLMPETLTLEEVMAGIRARVVPS